jgi:hypothetical protein
VGVLFHFRAVLSDESGRTYSGMVIAADREQAALFVVYYLGGNTDLADACEAWHGLHLGLELLQVEVLGSGPVMAWVPEDSTRAIGGPARRVLVLDAMTHLKHVDLDPQRVDQVFRDASRHR